MEGSSSEIKQSNCSESANGEKFSIENDGRLSKLLRASLDKTIEKYIRSAKYSVFAENFAPIHKQHNDDLIKIHHQFVSKLQSNIKEEVNLMYQQETIISYLNNLDDLIKNADSDQNSCKWRPSGIPETDLKDHLYFVKEQYKTELEQILTEQIEDTENLAQVVNNERKNLLALMDEIKNKYEDHKVIDSLHNSLPIQKLQDYICSSIES